MAHSCSRFWLSSLLAVALIAAPAIASANFENQVEVETGSFQVCAHNRNGTLRIGQLIVGEVREDRRFRRNPAASAWQIPGVHRSISRLLRIEMSPARVDAG